MMQIVKNKMIELRRTKDQIPAGIHCLFTMTDLALEEIYYSEQGERCQCNQCNHRIRNIYVVMLKLTGEVKHYGSNCLEHHGIRPSVLINYWTKTKKTIKYQIQKEQRAKENTAKYVAELQFMDAFLEITYNGFLDSIQNHIRCGNPISEKQIAAVHKFMERTDLEKMVEEEQPRIERYYHVLELFEKLNRVHFGAYPGVTPYHSMKQQFSQRGNLTDKQIAFLEKMVTRFRRQWLR